MKINTYQFDVDIFERLINDHITHIGTSWLNNTNVRTAAKICYKQYLKQQGKCAITGLTLKSTLDIPYESFNKKEITKYTPCGIDFIRHKAKFRKDNIRLIFAPIAISRHSNSALRNTKIEIMQQTKRDSYIAKIYGYEQTSPIRIAIIEMAARYIPKHKIFKNIPLLICLRKDPQHSLIGMYTHFNIAYGSTFKQHIGGYYLKDNIIGDSNTQICINKEDFLEELYHRMFDKFVRFLISNSVQ